MARPPAIQPLEKRMRSVTLASSLRLAARPVTAAMLSLQLALPAGALAQSPAQIPPQVPAPSAMQDTQTPTASDDSKLQVPAPDDSMRPSAPLPALLERPVTRAHLSGDATILQVLNRFTYGPRPGDLEHVRSIGLNAWFHQQLNPSLIDDSSLETRLAAFPAMQMPLDRLMQLYPTNSEIKASMDNRMSVPGGDAAHAIYATQQQRYKERKEKKAGTADDSDNMAEVQLPDTPANILALPPEKRFKLICHLNPAQLRQLRSSLDPADRDKLTDGFTPAQVEALAAFNGPRNVVAAEDVQVKLLRDIYSERQLQEIMVDFWLNHFNVYMKKNQQAPYFIAAYERQTIRPHALGSFQTLLMATATSPAMLSYLDNSESVGAHSEFALRGGSGGKNKASGLNENYARELMELHTIGVNGGYTQKDVTEVAKVFTGWTVSKRYREGIEDAASFDPTKHEPGNKLVLGQKIKENGEGEGFTVLKMLANSPQCARFISTKLAVRFVSDTPPPAMVDRMAATFLETHGDIRHVLLAMVNSPEFFTQGAYRAKVKTPQDYVISAVRAAGANVESTAALAAAISDLGMPLYGMQTPNGYSMKSEDWNSTTALVSRMNFALALASNRVLGVSTDLDALLGPRAGSLTPDEKDRVLESRLLHVPVSPRTEQLIMAQTATETSQQAAELRQVSTVGKGRDPLSVRHGPRASSDPDTLDTQASLAAGLIFGSPEFQRR